MIPLPALGPLLVATLFPARSFTFHSSSRFHDFIHRPHRSQMLCAVLGRDSDAEAGLAGSEPIDTSNERRLACYCSRGTGSAR